MEKFRLEQKECLMYMAKKLSMKTVKEHVKQRDESIEIEFNGGENTVNLRPFFNPDENEECVENIGESLKVADEEGIEISDRHFWHFVNFNIIKTYSDISISKNPITDIQYFIQFIRSQYYKEIMSYMVEEELADVYEKLFEVLANHERVKRQIEKTREDVQTMPIENEELRNRIQGQSKQIPEV